MSDVVTSESVVPGPLLSLKQAREASGLHIAALAASLKVPVKKLEALEAGRYDELPDMTFARALASSACRHLKVDPAQVLQQIPLARVPQLGDQPSSINAPFNGAVPAPVFNPAGWLARPAVLAAIAVLLAALVLLLMPAREPEQPEAVMPPEAAPQVPVSSDAGVAEEVVAPPVNAATLPDVPTSTAVVSTSVSPVVVSAATATQVASGPAGSATTSGVDPSVVLRIAVTGDSWVEVVNGQGGASVQRMLKAGEALDFSAKPPYAVVIGRADVAQVTVRGKALDIAQFARNSVARFEVK